MNVPSLLRIRTLRVIAGPGLLAILLIAHPAYRDDALTELLPFADRWLVVHVLQLVLIGLVGASLVWLVEGLPDRSAVLARWSAGAFVLLYGAMDAVAGLATGVLARRAASLPAEEQADAAQAIDALFTHAIVGGQASLLALAATIAWLVTAVSASIALARSGAPRGAVVALVTIAFLFAVGHTPPFGPAALGAFAVVAATLRNNVDHG